MYRKVLLSVAGMIAVVLVVTAGLRTESAGVAPTPEVIIQPVILEYVLATPVPTGTPVAAAYAVRPANPVVPGQSVNGVAFSKLVVASDVTRTHVRSILAQGRAKGRNPKAFSKVGDSTMLYPAFLVEFDGSDYKLGPYSALQPTITHFAGSFARTSAAVKKGMHTWTEFDPSWAPQDICAPGEGPLDCELRINNPSVVLIRLGTNDTDAPDEFKTYLTRIVDTCLERGIVPILATKADRLEGSANTLNRTITRMATSKAVPLWDYDAAATTIPGRGLDQDGIHYLGGGTHNYSTSTAFRWPGPVEDITALAALDTVRRLINP